MMVPVDDRTVLGSQQLRGGDVGRRQTGDERNGRDEAAILWHGVRHPAALTIRSRPSIDAGPV